MKRIGIAAVLACAAASASAFIPPTYRIAVVSEERGDLALGHALVEYMVAEQALFRLRDDSFGSAARACLKQDDVDECVRAEIARLEPEPRVAALAIVAAPGGDGRQKWRCVGSGKREAAAESVNAVIDVKAALFGEEEKRVENLRAAVGCIQAAANESSPQ